MVTRMAMVNLIVVAVIEDLVVHEVKAARMMTTVVAAPLMDIRVMGECQEAMGVVGVTAGELPLEDIETTTLTSVVTVVPAAIATVAVAVVVLMTTVLETWDTGRAMEAAVMVIIIPALTTITVLAAITDKVRVKHMVDTTIEGPDLEVTVAMTSTVVQVPEGPLVVQAMTRETATAKVEGAERVVTARVTVVDMMTDEVAVAMVANAMAELLMEDTRFGLLAVYSLNHMPSTAMIYVLESNRF